MQGFGQHQNSSRTKPCSAVPDSDGILIAGRHLKVPRQLAVCKCLVPLSSNKLEAHTQTQGSSGKTHEAELNQAVRSSGLEDSSSAGSQAFFRGTANLLTQEYRMLCKFNLLTAMRSSTDLPPRREQVNDPPEEVAGRSLLIRRRRWRHLVAG